MLEYTKAAIKKTADDFKRADYIRNLVTQVLYILYLVYAANTGLGVFWANIALLALSAAYFIFFLAMTAGRALKPPRKAQKLAGTIFKRCKQLVKLFTLCVMVYGVYSTTKAVTPIAVVFSALMIVGWVLQIVFEVLIRIFISRAHFIIEGIEADYENLVKPAKTVGNFFKKLAGKEVEPEKEKTKTRLWLDKKVEENRAEKAERLREEKRRKKQAKADAKNTVFLSPEKEAKALPEKTEAVEVFEEPPLLPEAATALALSEGKTEKKKRKRKKAE